MLMFNNADEGNKTLPFLPKDLEQTRSSFSSSGTTRGKKGKRLVTRSWILIAVLVIVVIGGLREGISFSSFLYPFLIFGGLFLISGWLSFSLLEVIEGIPEAKIEGAANGLNEIQGVLVAEKNAITAPLSKAPCLFYQIELQRLVQTRDGAYWSTICRYGKGTPLLFTDDTGYLDIDLANADIETSNNGTRLMLMNSNNKVVTTSSKEGKEAIQYIKTNPESLDFSNIGVNLSDSYAGSSLTFFGEEMSLFERTLYVQQGGFAMGRVMDTGKTFNGKQVKSMVYDSNTKILSFREQTKEQIEINDKIMTYASFGIGGVLLLLALIILL